MLLSYSLPLLRSATASSALAQTLETRLGGVEVLVNRTVQEERPDTPAESNVEGKKRLVVEERREERSTGKETFTRERYMFTNRIH